MQRVYYFNHRAAVIVAFMAILIVAVLAISSRSLRGELLEQSILVQETLPETQSTQRTDPGHEERDMLSIWNESDEFSEEEDEMALAAFTVTDAATCACAQQFACAQVCEALRLGHAVRGAPQAEDFFHTHPVFHARNGQCRGTLGHAHEFDRRRNNNPNNFNLWTDANGTSYIATPGGPTELGGLDIRQLDEYFGWMSPDDSTWDFVEFRLVSDGGQCEGREVSASCGCQGSQLEICLFGHAADPYQCGPAFLPPPSPESCANEPETSPCRGKVQGDACADITGRGICVEDARNPRVCHCDRD